MSNTNHKIQTDNIKNDRNTSDSKNESNKETRWSFIQSDLNDALNTWSELEKADLGLSPEEEQLQKIKSIIGQLKEKLEQF